MLLNNKALDCRLYFGRVVAKRAIKYVDWATHFLILRYTMMPHEIRRELLHSLHHRSSFSLRFFGEALSQSSALSFIHPQTATSIWSKCILGVGVAKKGNYIRRLSNTFFGDLLDDDASRNLQGTATLTSSSSFFSFEIFRRNFVAVIRPVFHTLTDCVWNGCFFSEFERSTREVFGFALTIMSDWVTD